jgi:hypothetical protein
MKVWLSLVAAALWTGLVLYPPTVTELREPLILLGACSLLSMVAFVVSARWPFAVAAACLWIIEYGSALTLADRADLAAPALGAAGWLALELVDWSELDARELRRVMSSAAVVGVLGVAAALVCVVAGLVVTGTLPLLVALGAGAGVGALGLGVMLTRRALAGGSDPFVPARAEHRSQRKSL